MLAAIALRDRLAEAGVPGRVRYYACPAEENGGGKGFMSRAGVFDDVAAAFCWHPAAFNAVIPSTWLANVMYQFDFKGVAAHAAAAPDLGRSALDAMELTSVGVQYLREHVPQETRMHAAILNGGSIAPNVVPAAASAY